MHLVLWSVVYIALATVAQGRLRASQERRGDGELAWQKGARQ